MGGGSSGIASRTRDMSVLAMMAHRGLRRWCARYKDVRDHPDIRAGYPSIPDLVGIYENPSGIEPARILLGHDRIYLEGVDGLASIALQDLLDVHVPEDDESPAVITLDHRDGHQSHVSVEGRDGRYRDVYLVGNVLRRAVWITKERAPSA